MAQNLIMIRNELDLKPIETSETHMHDEQLAQQDADKARQKSYVKEKKY